MTATWDAWTPDVAIDVPGCPSFTIERAVKLTVIDFCERSHWFQRTTAALDIAAGAAERTFSVGTGEVVVGVKQAWISDVAVPIYGPSDVNEDWPDWQTRTGAPECIVMERPSGYYVVPASTGGMTGALRFRLAIGYLETATGCDDSIRAEWRDAIADCAKSRLFAIPNMPWTNPAFALDARRSYERAVGSAIVRAIRTPAKRPLQTKPYYF